MKRRRTPAKRPASTGNDVADTVAKPDLVPGRYRPEDGSIIWGKLEYHLPWDDMPVSKREPTSLAELREVYGLSHGRLSKKETARLVAALPRAWFVVLELLSRYPDTSSGNASRALDALGIGETALKVSVASASFPSEFHAVLYDLRLRDFTRSLVERFVELAQSGDHGSTEFLVDLAALIIEGIGGETAPLQKNLRDVASKREKFPVLLGLLRKDEQNVRDRLQSLELATATTTRALDPERGRPISLETPINQLARSLLVFFSAVKSSSPMIVGPTDDSTLGLPSKLYARIVALPSLEKKCARKWVAVARELIRHRYHRELGDIEEVQDLGAGRRQHTKSRSGLVGIESNQTDGVSEALSQALLRMSPTKRGS